MIGGEVGLRIGGRDVGTGGGVCGASTFTSTDLTLVRRPTRAGGAGGASSAAFTSATTTILACFSVQHSHSNYVPLFTGGGTGRGAGDSGLSSS